MSHHTLTRTAPWIFAACVTTAVFAAPLPQAGVTINRPMLDAHNCYPDEGRWPDRLSRALGTGQAPIGIEQDLVWKPDGRGGGTSVVAHDDKLVGGEPTLEDHFFKVIAPQMEAALRTGDATRWPLIVLHFDFKTNEPEHHRFVSALLEKYDRWLSTAERGADDRPRPISRGPLLVLTEAGEGQERDFYQAQPVGARLRIFGTVPSVPLAPGASREAQVEAAITASPTTLLPTGVTNYRRWANFPWAVVERGGQARAEDWAPTDARRLQSIVARAHELGLWLRFYTLDGFTSDTARGWSAGYNFGSPDAVQPRWRAAIEAGVDFIATDQYEDFAAEMTRSPRAAR